MPGGNGRNVLQSIKESFPSRPVLMLSAYPEDLVAVSALRRDFNSRGHAQRLLSVFGVIALFFRPRRHLLAAVNYRAIMRRRFTQWRELLRW
jgi:CheY-like chemotaxis protein